MSKQHLDGGNGENQNEGGQAPAQTEVEKPTKPSTPEGAGAQEDLNDDDLSGLDEKTKKYILKLRKENAKHRTAVKTTEDRLGKLEKGLKSAFGLEDQESVDPEKQISSLQSEREALAFKAAVMETAIENGLNMDQANYFQFLLAQKSNELEEGEELSDEALTDLVTKSKAIGGKGGVGGSTSVTGGGTTPRKPGASGDITLEQFTKMSMTEKSKLYQNDANTYNALMAEARSKKMVR